MVWARPVVGVFVTEQLVLTGPVMELVLAVPRVQLAKAVLSVSWLKLTVPVGAVAEVGVLSVTVAVQLVGLPTGTDAGEQLTAELGRGWWRESVKISEVAGSVEKKP